MVSPEMASEDPKWWRDDRYAIFDLNVNSSVVYPENNEELVIDSAPSTYTVKGYAYSGGGRRITRVEISLDKGRCMYKCITYPRKLNSCLTNYQFSMAPCAY